ncbi:DUF1566 domain-containing protein [bacterium]|nr:DUF1566 domain-containing protein [bacterium]
MKKAMLFLIISIFFVVSCGKSKVVDNQETPDEADDTGETTTDEDADGNDEEEDKDEPDEENDEDSPDDEVPDYSETYGLPKCSLQGKTPCYDPATDLVWSSLTSWLRYEDALIYCYDLDEGGFYDWYLPNIDELRTLVRHCSEIEPGGACRVSEEADCLYYDCGCNDEICTKPKCSQQEDEIFSILWDTYELWSSSEWPEDETVIWTLDFSVPSIEYGYSWHSTMRVRCTRNVHSSGEDEGTETRKVECLGLPENAEWNTVSSITQTFNGAKWEPTDKGVFDEEPSTEECRFKCFDDFTSEFFAFKDEDYVKCSPECGKTEAEICINPDSGIYSDSRTGLMWSSFPPEDDYNDYNGWAFNNAAAYCENLTEGGYTDWKLPTIDELRTLIRNCPETETGGACSLDNIPDDIFDENNKVPDECLSCEPEEGHSSKYSRIGDFVPLWSSTESPVRVNYVIESYWYVDFSSGMVSSIHESANQSDILVRCVRKEKTPVTDDSDILPDEDVTDVDENDKDHENKPDERADTD